jgi:NAD(P)-dependent dehydrogenase (short-subunit alcohol dehydrogenase family)
MTTDIQKSLIAVPPVWFITGCSTGFGRALATLLLKRGDRVVVTARDPETVRDFESKGEVLILPLDVTDQGAIETAVKAAEARFGVIDVLVNNAGIGYFGAIEEGEDLQVRRLFEINVFGLARMIQAVLPGMRKRRKGYIVNLSSIGGLVSFPAVGYYNASKFAVEGLSEALWQEVEPLGIGVMLVEPSGFRTDWAGRSADERRRRIDDYETTAGVALKRLREGSGHQAGDPARAAQAIVDAIESGKPPHRLLLGNFAYEGAMAKLEELRREFTAGEAIARAADAPKVKHGKAA